jgi:hypothetical protein
MRDTFWLETDVELRTRVGNTAPHSLMFQGEGCVFFRNVALKARTLNNISVDNCSLLSSLQHIHN